MGNRINRISVCPLTIRVLIVLLFVRLFSCNPVSEITIEILEPAEITIPPYIQLVSFINRSYTPWLAIDPSDTAKRPVQDLFIIDTIISNKLFLGLIDALNVSTLFDLDEPPIYQLRRSDGIRIPEPFTVDQVGIICDTTSTDCLISLEGYLIDDTLSYHFLYFDEGYEVIYMLDGIIQWRIYDGISGTVIDDFLFTDTINWVVTGDNLDECMEELPEVVNAYREYSYQVGFEYGKRLCPEWYEAKRFFYRTGSRAMIKAAKLADMGHWQEALKIWKSVSESEKEMIAAKASFNVALHYEMEDRLIPAIDWATISYNQYKDGYTKQYLEILEQRKLNKLKLQEQLPAE